jgi:hypothetical protein
MKRLVQASLAGIVTLLPQHTFATEDVDLRSADAELASHLGGGQEAARAQPIEAARQTIDQTGVTHSFGGEGLALPVAITERVELRGDFAIRAALKQLIELRDDLWARLAHHGNRLSALDG